MLNRKNNETLLNKGTPLYLRQKFVCDIVRPKYELLNLMRFVFTFFFKSMCFQSEFFQKIAHKEHHHELFIISLEEVDDPCLLSKVILFFMPYIDIFIIILKIKRVIL